MLPILGMAAKSSGLPSRPKFQAVSVGTPVNPLVGQLYTSGYIVSTASNPSAIWSAPIPLQRFDETDAAFDEKKWRLYANGSHFYADTLKDDDSAAGAPFLDAVRVGTVVTALNLNATSVLTNGVSIAASSGTFTPTYTGFSTPPGGTVAWFKVGGLACLNSQSLTGTSNANTFTITNIPSAIQPTGLTGGYVRAVDNGSNVAAAVWTLSGSTMIFEKVHGSTTSWTASGSKGVNGQSFCWTIASF